MGVRWDGEVLKPKVLLVSSHPVQYASPMYRAYGNDPRVDVTVAYCSLRGAKLSHDHDFNLEIQWDVPLLKGYKWLDVSNRSPAKCMNRFLSPVSRGLWRLIERGRFDVVVCYGYRTVSFWLAALACRMTGAKLVFTIDAHTIHSRDARWKSLLKKVILPFVFRVPNAVFVASTASRRFCRDMGVADDHVFLTPNVVDTSFFSQLSQDTDSISVRQRWRIPPEATVALFCGKLVPWKRPGDILEAAAPLEDLHVVFAGDGPLRSHLQERARQLGLLSRSHFLGFINQTELPTVYAASDFLVLPSEFETFGLVVNEAFACGRPAVISDACGAGGDLVVEGKTGHVFRAGDVVGLMDSMETLLSDRARLQRMGQEARRRIDGWGPDQNLEAFIRACKALTQAGSRLRGDPWTPGVDKGQEELARHAHE
jgi:glycosyltransferase involved in cell wall biosynthesis